MESEGTAVQLLARTRQAYPLPGLPDHLVVIGSGVTVEFVHMFRSFGRGESVVARTVDDVERVDVRRRGGMPLVDLSPSGGRDDCGSRSGVTIHGGLHRPAQPRFIQRGSELNLQVDAPRLRRRVEVEDGLVEGAEGLAVADLAPFLHATRR